jgi:hypothetical protein
VKKPRLSGRFGSNQPTPSWSSLVMEVAGS